MALTSQSLRAAIGPLQFSLRHWKLRNLTLHPGILPYKHLYLIFARLYNAAASPASRLRSAGSLAIKIHVYSSAFLRKILLIREGLLQLTADAAYSTIPSTSCQCELTSFERISPAYIPIVCKSCKVKIYGALDPLPASVLNGCKVFFFPSSLIW